MLRSIAELLEPLQLCWDSLQECGAARVAKGALLDLLRRVRIFGLTLVQLDIRQDARRHHEALQAIAAASGSWVMVLPVPVSLLRLAARLSTLVPGIPAIKDAEVLRLCEDKAVNVEGMKDVLEVTPRPLKQGLAETFAKQ